MPKQILTSNSEVSLEMRHEMHYKRYGVRIAQHLKHPVVTPLLELPPIDLSVIHYINPYNEDDFGISPNNPLIRNSDKKMGIYHVEPGYEIEGRYRLGMDRFNKMRYAYQKTQPKMFWFRKESKAGSYGTRRDWQVIYNHQLAFKGRVIWGISPLKEYHIWLTKYRYYLKQVKQALSVSNRHQIILFHLPKSIPTIPQLKLVAKNFKRQHVALFEDYSSWTFLDLWRWLDEAHHKDSVLGKILNDKLLERVDMLIISGDSGILINLGLLKSWASGKTTLVDDELDDAEAESGISASSSRRIQQRLHQMISQLIATRDAKPTIQHESQEAKKILTVVEDASINEDKESETLATPDNVLDQQPAEIIPVHQAEIKKGSVIYDADNSTKPINGREDEKTDEKTDGLHQTLSDQENETDSQTDVTVPPRRTEGRDDVSASAGRDESSPETKQTEGTRDHTTLGTERPSLPHSAKLNDGQRGIFIRNLVRPIVPKENLVPNYNGYTGYDPTTGELTSNGQPNDFFGNIADVASAEIENEFMAFATDYKVVNGQVDAWKKQLDELKKKPNPYNKNESLESVLTKNIDRSINEKDITIPDIPLVTDKSMLQSTLLNFDKQYINEVLPRDVLRATMSLQKAGLMVTDYQIEDTSDVASHFETHTIRVEPIGGQPTTIRINMPKVSEDGVIYKGGTKYFLRKARRDKPIRKIDDNKVALTSYYGKVFCSLSAKKKHDLTHYALKAMEKSIAEKVLKDVQYGKIISDIKTIPPIVHGIMQRYRGFTSVKTGAIFDLSHLAYDEKRKMLTLGPNVIYYHETNIYVVDGEPVEEHDLFGFSQLTGPIGVAEIRILGQAIPIGFVLARKFGLSELILNYLGLSPDRYERSARIERNPNNLILTFDDEKWVFDRSALSYRDLLILGGLVVYERDLRDYAVAQLGDRDVYGKIMMDNGIQLRYERELDLMDQLFIDDITRELLIQMNEPTDLTSLYIRAVELLATSHYVDEINMDDMVIKGYERVAGAVYQTMVKNLRQFKSKPVSAKRKFTMKPDDVWIAISTDSSIEIVKDINPIQGLKEIENVTFMGEGGRSRRSMTKRHRGFHESDFGTVSEATVDSADVGITTFLTANPQFTDYTGTTKRLDPKEAKAADILSSPMLLAPFSDRDDGKRINFIGIQASHRIPIKGAMPSPIRTGYENIIAHRGGKGFAYASKDKGKIKEKGQKYVIISYDDPKLDDERIEIGIKIASAEGSFFRHDIVCDLPVGYKFDKGEILVYNKAFFIRDILDRRQVILCDKTIASTILIESNDTYEDSSAISATLAGQLKTSSVKKRLVIVNASDEIFHAKQLGDEVDFDTELLFINDASFKGQTGFDKSSLQVLKRLSQISPKAKYRGKIISIECFYFCEEEALSDSIRELVQSILTDKFKGAKLKVSERRSMTGQINEPLKFGSDLVGPGQVAIQYYIENNVVTEGGDKIVVSNQMKSVISRVFPEKHETKSGREIHAMFGYTSIAARIVASAELIGTTTTLLKEVTRRAVEAYRSK